MLALYDCDCDSNVSALTNNDVMTFQLVNLSSTTDMSKSYKRNLLLNITRSQE